MKRLPPYALTDVDLVEFAWRLDALQIQMQNLLVRLESSPHPGATDFANDARNQCTGLAWPTHVVHRYLEQPDAWETGDWGIRKVSSNQP